MKKNKLAFDVANNLRNLADSIEDLITALDEGEDNQTKQKSEKPKENAKNKDTKTPTLEEVRAKLAAKSQEGKQTKVKALITDLGAKKLSDVPEEKYPELLEKAEAL